MDKKAKKILLDTFWSSNGWKKGFKIDVADLAYAKSKGLMFAPLYIKHDELVIWLLKGYENTCKKMVTDAFLASLSTRRLDWRFLGSYAISRVFPDHKLIKDTNYPHTTICKICEERKEFNENLNILNFERIKWGGVRQTSIIYAAFNLEQLTKLQIPTPVEEDFNIFNKLIQTILSSNAKDRASQLEKNISGIIKSNKEERRVLLDILGVSGILENLDYKGFFDNYIPKSQQITRGVSDWGYPIDWWTGGDGINKRAFDFYFGDYNEINPI